MASLGETMKSRAIGGMYGSGLAEQAIGRQQVEPAGEVTRLLLEVEETVSYCHRSLDGLDGRLAGVLAGAVPTNATSAPVPVVDSQVGQSLLQLLMRVRGLNEAIAGLADRVRV